MSDTKTKTVAKTIGRRKRAIASVRLISGIKEFVVNDTPIEKYFPGLLAKMKYEQPLKVVSASDYGGTVRVHGGGISGQLDAVVLGISRALSELKKDFHTQLRSAGLLTRDSRKRQRRMVGTGGKARRTKQSPKR